MAPLMEHTYPKDLHIDPKDLHIDPISFTGSFLKVKVKVLKVKVLKIVQTSCLLTRLNI
jgi:hypothetical protein